jgi:acyl-CoA thioesterase-1
MSKLFLRFLCALALLLATALAAAAASPVIVVFGDSLSAGYGVPQGQGWVDLLRQRLQQKGLAWQVINASISGETTLGGRNRLPGVLSAHRPRVLILELGANDALRGQSLAESRENLLQMVRTARAAGAKVLLVGMRIPPNYGPAYTKKFQAMYEDVAREAKVPLVPFLLEGFAEEREMFQADGVHPTAQAQPRLLENVWGALQRMLGARG